MSYPTPDEFIANCSECEWHSKSKKEAAIEKAALTHAKASGHEVFLEARGTIYLGSVGGMEPDGETLQTSVDWQEA